MTKTILIVDNSPDGVLLTKIALSLIDSDIRIESENSARGALEFLASAADLPALILLDLKMPGMNGIDTLKRIRADERMKHLPVIIVTLSMLESDMEAAYEAGATGFIHKAIRIDAFARDLEQYIKRWVDNRVSFPA